jgi:uncharacterized membrane protein
VTAPTDPRANRWTYVDFARGVAVIGMVLDHANLYTNPLRPANEGLFGNYPDPVGFWDFIARFSTMPGAVVFFVLAGMMMGRHMVVAPSAEMKRHRAIAMAQRGLVFIAIEVCVMTFGWSFPQSVIGGYYFLVFQVIGAFGLCFLAYAVLQFLPPFLLGTIALALIFGRELLEPPGFQMIAGFGDFVRAALWEPGLAPGRALVLFPALAWLPSLLIGDLAGRAMARREQRGLPAVTARRLLVGMLACYAAFAALRFTGAFGGFDEPAPDHWMTVFYTSRYPPSITYLLIALGWSQMLMLWGMLLARRPGPGTRFTELFGRQPFFVYIIHLFVVGLIAFVMPIGYKGGNVWWACLVFVLATAVLFRPTRWYDDFKRRNRRRYWLLGMV